MSFTTRLIGHVTNAALHPVGAVVLPAYTLKCWPRFRLGERQYNHFLHPYNCGQLPIDATERTVELALADFWLDSVQIERVIEIGAVSCYYWPGRVRNIVDPADGHKLVSDRRCILDVDLSKCVTLCISTLEHIGSGEYGLPKNPALLRNAIAKLCSESPCFLATVPTGYNSEMDKVLFEERLPDGVSLRFVVRSKENNEWREELDPRQARLPYGRGKANSVAILDRGGILF